MSNGEIRDEVRRVVLASGSRYRASILKDAGINVVIDPPDVDERAFDHFLVEEGPEAFSLRLALLKARAVAPRHPRSTLVAADQVGVVDVADGVMQLHKQPDVELAVHQLLAMSGRQHRLVNGVVVMDVDSGRYELGVDVMIISMRDFGEDEARRYVMDFEPFDCAGSYRLEDQEAMKPGSGFITAIDGEDHSGVKGMPLPLLGRLFSSLYKR